MDQAEDGSKKNKPKVNCFIGCFGVSDETSVSRKKHELPPENQKCKHSRQWMFWSRLRMKKTGTKTVPVDSSVADQVGRSREIHVVKPEKMRNEKDKDIILESSELLNKTDRKYTCQRGSSSFGKKAGKKNGGNYQPNSPENTLILGLTNPKPPHSAAPISQRNEHKTTRNAAKKFQVGEDKKHRTDDMLAGKYDTVAGLSILTVTLVIMLFCGKICAILCTSAWLYFLSRFKIITSQVSDVTVRNKSSSGELDLNSEEHKKKVVLEGFLERNRRNVAGAL